MKIYTFIIGDSALQMTVRVPAVSKFRALNKLRYFLISNDYVSGIDIPYSNDEVTATMVVSPTDITMDALKEEIDV